MRSFLPTTGILTLTSCFSAFRKTEISSLPAVVLPQGFLGLDNAICQTSVCAAHACTSAHTCVWATVWATLNLCKSQQQHSSSSPQPRTHHQKETHREARGGGQRWRGEGQREKRESRLISLKVSYLLCHFSIICISPDTHPAIIHFWFWMFAKKYIFFVSVPDE